MMLLEVGDRRHPLSAGELAIGSDPACAIVLSHPSVLSRHAIVVGSETAAAIVPAQPDALVMVNGVRVGAAPMPLLHGDRVQLASVELRVTDSTRLGQTQMRPAVGAAAGGGARAADAAAGGPAHPRRNGRLVSLLDGREYRVGHAGLVLGREATCDVVVSDTDVSRRHARLTPTTEGYLLADESANGTFVNGERLDVSRLLRRGDTIRVGRTEFRFHADDDIVPDLPVPAGAESRLADTLVGLAPVPTPPAGGVPPAPAPVLASLLVRSGGQKGRRYDVRTPVVNIGRADYNDFVLPEPSVSQSHAKLQRRGAVWLVADLESTNGTQVDGEPVRGEAPLSPGATLTLGEVVMLFESRDRAAPGDEGTAVMPRVAPAAARPAPRPAPPTRRPPPLPADEEPPSRPGIVIAAVVAAIACAILALRLL